MHCCVGIVQAFLEINVFFVHLLYKDCHLTENSSINNGRQDHEQSDDYAFFEFSWSYFVEAENHDGVIAHAQVLLCKLFFLEQFRPRINVINLWNPSWLTICIRKGKPKGAGEQMDIQYEIEDHIAYLENCFCFLGVV